jgi:hypothetical protein
MDYVVQYAELVSTLLSCTEHNDTQARVQTTKILTRIGLNSETSHSTLLDAMDVQRKKSKEKNRFARLVQSLQAKEARVDWQIGCLSLINAIVNIPTSLKARLQLRQEFIALHLLEVLDVRKKGERERKGEERISDVYFLLS